MLHVTPSKLVLAHLTGCPGSDSKTSVEVVDGRVIADNSKRYRGKYREKIQQTNVWQTYDENKCKILINDCFVVQQ